MCFKQILLYIKYIQTTNELQSFNSLKLYETIIFFVYNMQLICYMYNIEAFMYMIKILRQNIFIMKYIYIYIYIYVCVCICMCI